MKLFAFQYSVFFAIARLCFLLYEDAMANPKQMFSTCFISCFLLMAVGCKQEEEKISTHKATLPGSTQHVFSVADVQAADILLKHYIIANTQNNISVQFDLEAPKMAKEDIVYKIELTDPSGEIFGDPILLKGQNNITQSFAPVDQEITYTVQVTVLSADGSKQSTTFTIPEKLVFEPFAELPSRHPEKITSDYIQSVKVNDVSQDATQVVMEVILNLEKVPVAMIPQGVDFNINYKLVDDADQLDDIIVLNPKRNQNSGFAPGPAGQTFFVTESRNLKIPVPDQYTMFTLFVQFANISTAEVGAWIKLDPPVSITAPKYKTTDTLSLECVSDRKVSSGLNPDVKMPYVKMHMEGKTWSALSASMIQPSVGCMPPIESKEKESVTIAAADPDNGTCIMNITGNSFSMRMSEEGQATLTINEEKENPEKMTCTSEAFEQLIQTYCP
ncbi:MAG: hypothetical protein KDK51_02285 [Deltaproteobacteria bacterium]|nr:hypothetical protein [Deltaproteobacteria bacterium]